MLHLKRNLYTYCLSIADERIKNAENAIISAQEASVDDTKSSAGDKYETTREMMQQEISRHQIQLLEAKKLKQSIASLNPEKASILVEIGSLVFTSGGDFYIGIPAGKIEMEGKVIYGISPASPIFLKMKGLKAGENFSFNGKEIRILSVF